MVGDGKTYSKRMEALLPSSVPYFVSKNTILKSALLCQESSPNGGFFVGLEFIGDLVMGEDYELDLVVSIPCGTCVQIEGRLMTFQQQPHLYEERTNVSNLRTNWSVTLLSCGMRNGKDTHPVARA